MEWWDAVAKRISAISRASIAMVKATVEGERTPEQAFQKPHADRATRPPSAPQERFA